ncbi:MAG: trypsin-like peptidase domain-containing protein [Desulfarculaceae bacterium]|jgi:S1-C subfamily serine protease
MPKHPALLLVLTVFLIWPASAHASDLSDVFKQVNPSVVTVLTVEEHTSQADAGTIVYKKGLGSGVVISAKGLVLTAAHVVQLADKVILRFPRGKWTSAQVVRVNKLADVALLRMQKIPAGLKAARLGEVKPPPIGEQVFVVGAPYGLAHTLTVGHLSGRRLSPNFSGPLVPIEFLQTDASINQGNSGGPLCDRQGRVIGIVSHIRSKSGGSEGLGFATSLRTVSALLLGPENFWTGLDFYWVRGRLAKALNLPQGAGLLTQRAAKGSPGQRLGLRGGNTKVRLGRNQILLGGDVILKIGDMPVSAKIAGLYSLRKYLKKFPKNTPPQIFILREGKLLKLKPAG